MLEYFYNDLINYFQVLDTFDSWRYFQASRDSNRDVYLFVLGCGVVAVFLTLVAIGQEIYDRIQVKRRSKRKITRDILKKK